MFRKTLFWLHLVAGLVAGVAIGIMCFTGTVLAFEKELVAWAERDARQIAPPPAATPRLTLTQLQVRLREAQPEVRPASVVLHRDPRAAVAFAAGRSGTFYVNPYTGEVRQPQSVAMGEFMRTMTGVHRYLGFTGDTSRPRGKLINGICNLAFFVLAVTGLYLWMPRAWSWRAVQPVIWFRQNATAKARDFNWHNTIGFWCAPVLIVLTLTAVPISFRWGGELLYTLTGTALPSTGPQSSGAPPPVALVPPAPAGSSQVPADLFIAAAERLLPAWKTLTLRLTSSNAAQPVTLTVREQASWPRTASTTLQFDPFTAQLLRRDGHAELNAARQVRGWTRFLHTGEALGWVGQFVAGLACLGGCFLVYTGFALSWRRFFGGPKTES
ncbi:MAG: PepSY-associated TM helix domain-containing protein [Opitutaceae bacterium]|nr:PepSY-associated TM helix domain-containing protein [Opitutaceae bacterium]